MKTSFLYIFLLFILSSCVNVYFKDPQPKNGILLNEIPTELCGKWIEKGGLLVEKDGITFIEFVEDSLTHTVDTIYQKAFLSDSMLLYKAKDLYVLNTRRQDENWEIIALNVQKNGDIKVYQITDPHLFAKDKNLILEEASFTIDEMDTVVKTLTPDYKESRNLHSATFSGQMKVKTLQKAIKQIDQLLVTLKKDGTFGVPEKKEEKLEE